MLTSHPSASASPRAAPPATVPESFLSTSSAPALASSPVFSSTPLSAQAPRPTLTIIAAVAAVLALAGMAVFWPALGTGDPSATPHVGKAQVVAGQSPSKAAASLPDSGVPDAGTTLRNREEPSGEAVTTF